MKTLYLVVTITTTLLLMIACGLYQSKVQKLQEQIVVSNKVAYDAMIAVARAEATSRQEQQDMERANELLREGALQLQQCTLILQHYNQ